MRWRPAEELRTDVQLDPSSLWHPAAHKRGVTQAEWTNDGPLFYIHGM